MNAAAFAARHFKATDLSVEARLYIHHAFVYFIQNFCIQYIIYMYILYDNNLVPRTKTRLRTGVIIFFRNSCARAESSYFLFTTNTENGLCVKTKSFFKTYSDVVRTRFHDALAPTVIETYSVHQRRTLI